LFSITTAQRTNQKEADGTIKQEEEKNRMFSAIVRPLNELLSKRCIKVETFFNAVSIKKVQCE
jgi:hypothetical protein